MPDQPDDDEEYESGIFRLGKRIFDTPNVARAYLVEQIGGWKTEFLGIFQQEIRRFFDKLHPAEEVRKIMSHGKLEISIRFTPDHAPRAEAGEKPAKPARKKKKG